MDLRWEGYKKVRGQVCKRIKERLQRLNLGDFFQYREYLERNTGEWEELEPLTHISISRFFRDKRSWDILGERILPGLAYEKAREGTHLRVWSAGCASGEEPYSFAILWEQQIVPYYPDVKLELLATDANDHLLKRAAEARYTAGSLREMPEEWKQEAFVKENATCRLIDKYQKLANFKKTGY